LIGTNTLAYFAEESLTIKNCIITLPLGANFIKLFSFFAKAKIAFTQKILTREKHSSLFSRRRFYNFALCINVLKLFSLSLKQKSYSHKKFLLRTYTLAYFAEASGATKQ
jgi:hypothetical protein